MKEIDNILRILRETKISIEKGDSNNIKQLSNQTIHSAAVYQDPDNVVVAVLVYSIGKILEREHYKEMDGWADFYGLLMKHLDIAIKSLEVDNIEKFRLSMGKIRNSLNGAGNLKEYIKDVFRKAEINKAFKIYEHGLSSEQTATLLGVSLWDLSTYIGQSTIAEANVSETMPVKQRIKLAEDFFG